MAPASGFGAGRRGLQVPCLLQPHTYVPQEIECLAASPDGAVLVAACSSGQVYIWRCTPDTQGGVQLDPTALAVHGWLGPHKVSGLDFCRSQIAAVGGLSSNFLVVCLLECGMRLLDPTDGQCVGVVTPQCRPNTIQVLQDGRHAVCSRSGEREASVLDLWTERISGVLVLPGAKFLHLAAPHQMTGANGTQDNLEGVPVSKATELRVAGVSTDSVSIWCISPKPADASDARGRLAETPAPFFTSSFRRVLTGGSGHPTSLCFERRCLAVSLADSILLWVLSESGDSVGPLLHIDRETSGSSLGALLGAQLLDPTTGGEERSESRTEKQEDEVNTSADDGDSARLLLVAWTESRIFFGKLRSLVFTHTLDAPTLDPWGSLPPAADCVCWWICGTLIVGATSTDVGDVLHVRSSVDVTLTPSWMKAASIEDIWMPETLDDSAQVLCATVVEVPRSTCLALGLMDGICVASLAGDEQARRLQAEAFGEPTLIIPLGHKYLVAGDCRGNVCWWSLSDWSLAGKVASTFRIPVAHVVRVWSPQGEAEQLFPDPALFAVLDAVGKCRLIDADTGDTLCVFQSQGGSSWMDEPLRVVYDRASRFVSVVSPARVCTWDASSGVYQGSAVHGDDDSSAPLSVRESVGSATLPAASTPGFRCASLRTLPLDGVDPVVWQAVPRASHAAALQGTGPEAAWRTTDLLLDGPRWRQPAIVFSPATLFARTAAEAVPPEPLGRTELTGTRDEAPPVNPMTNTRDRLQECVEAERASVPWPGDEHLRGLAKRLESINVSLPGIVFAVGVLGVDESPSFSLQHSQHSPPVCDVDTSQSADTEMGPGVRCESSSEASASLLLALARRTESRLVLDCGLAPQVGLTFIARVLLHCDVLVVLKQFALPALTSLLHASSKPVETVLAAWALVLQHSEDSEMVQTLVRSTELRHGTFGSAATLRDAASVLLGLVAHLEPELFERCCPTKTGLLVAEALCYRMFGPGSGPQLQSLACEVFAISFPVWRRHLKAAGPANRDESLEWFAVQALNLYQEPRVATSCLNLIMQVGAEDANTLLRVMGKAARSRERGPAYASSALLVLVAFIHNFAARVLPFLPKFTEVVLRCLEPSDPVLRRQSLLAVTSALHQLVQTFPMVAFHQPSQKFAVGTSDGLVVVYDLRTATKWRILEGHKGAIAALTFSKDGSQLGSYSAQDNSVRLWQCGSTGFLGGLLGTSSRCLQRHGLPPPAAAGSDAWRTVSLAWTERGFLRLVRDNSEVLEIRPH